MAVLLIIQTFIALALIGVILIQKTDSAGLGLGSGGGSGNVFTARGAANFLTRVTGILAAIFMANCLLMTIVSGRQLKHEGSLLTQTEQTPQPTAPVQGDAK